MVVVRGRFYMSTWVDAQQQPKTALEIEADAVGHDLAYGWTHFMRGIRYRGQGQGSGDAGEETRQDTGQPAADENAGTPENAGIPDYADRAESPEDDERLASIMAERELDDGESAELEPEAALGDSGVAQDGPGASLRGDGERSETMVLAV
jgi:single-strand DNA-binding protein